jgi:hypothetical protein
MTFSHSPCAYFFVIDQLEKMWEEIKIPRESWWKNSTFLLEGKWWNWYYSIVKIDLYYVNVRRDEYLLLIMINNEYDMLLKHFISLWIFHEKGQTKRYENWNLSMMINKELLIIIE